MGLKGMKAYTRKQRREQRRRNHVAKDLHSPKYRQRVKRNNREYEDWSLKDWLDEFEDE
jgi:hypothetical protein